MNFRIIMCIKLVGLFTETLVCVIVNDPLVLFITFLMYPVLPTHVDMLYQKLKFQIT
jgi:flagellar biosynthesis protein FliR